MKHLILAIIILAGMLFALPVVGPKGVNGEVKAQTVVTITGDGVRLRYGPGLEYGIYDKVSKGKKLTYCGTYGDWYKVSYKGQYLYVSRDFAGLHNSSSSSTHSSSTSTYYSGSYPYVAVHAKNLRVRTGPSTNYPYLVWNSTGKTVHLNWGDKLVYLNQIYNGFYKVKFDGRVCWIACEYASPSY